MDVFAKHDTSQKEIQSCRTKTLLIRHRASALHVKNKPGSAIYLQKLFATVELIRKAQM